MGSQGSLSTNGGLLNVAPHSNPYSRYTQKYTPKKLKEAFVMCEYIFNDSPHVYAALRKFGEYPVTTVTYDSPNENNKKRYKTFLDDILHVREVLIQCTLDKYIYGNVFLSLYQPFTRFLKCPSCGEQTNIEHIKYKYDTTKVAFTYKCKNCKKSVTASDKNIIDQKILLSRKINIIRWSPKNMNIVYNDITGEADYYYDIPKSIVSKVAKQPRTVNKMPIGFLQAIKGNVPFKFATNALYHMKVSGPSGLEQAWGIPPLMPVMSSFHYTAILRKANEAVASDYLTPLRILHPAQSSSNADPIVSASMSKWQDSMKKNIASWRKDPLHIMFSPFPMGETQMGGSGRTLLTLGEVQESEKAIVAALGIPMEFLYGGLTGSGMEATLRLLENQLETHVNDLKDILQWIANKGGEYLQWEPIKVGLTKFKLVDDANAKQIMFSLWQQGKQDPSGAMVSDDTIASLYEIDLGKERKKIKQETLNNARDQLTMQREMQKMQTDLTEQARQEAESQGAGPMGYDQQQVIAQADQIVEQLMQSDSGTKQSQLHQLQSEDYVLYSVVIQRLEQANLNNKRS